MSAALRAPRARTLLRLTGCVLAGALCMGAFTLSPAGYVGISDPPLRAGSPVWLGYALLLAGLFWLSMGRRAARLTPGMAALSLLFGTVNYFATTLFAYDTWAFLTGAGPWALALACILGQAAVLGAGLRVVCGWLEGAQAKPRETASAEPISTVGATAHPSVLGIGRAPLAGWADRAAARLDARLPRLARCRRRHPTLCAMAFLLLCWSPYLVIFYPGTIIWDMGEMLGMFYGLREITTWHPVLLTWLFGGCVELGRFLSGDNLGAFLFTALQTLALAYAIADGLRFLRRLSLSRVFRGAALLFFGLTPIFGSFAQAEGKDTLYTAALLVFAVRAAEAVRFGVSGRKGLGMLFISALLSALLRNNGLYVVAGASVALLALGARGWRPRLRLGAALLSALALSFAFTDALLPALNIKDETASGLYSVCFQQSARTLRDHGQDVTAAQYAEIDRVLDAAHLPALYETNISDPVKYTFRQYGQGRAAETAALARYRQTWLSQLQSYPLTYLEAFVAGNSGYYAFTPKIDAARTYHYQGGIRFVFETYDLGADPRYLHTTPLPGLERAQTLLAAYARGWRRVPGLELFLFCPTYTWLLVAAGYSLGRRKRWRELLAFLPALLSFGVCLLSPVNDYFRYFLPVAAMCPTLLGLTRASAPPPQPRRTA